MQSDAATADSGSSENGLTQQFHFRVCSGVLKRCSHVHSHGSVIHDSQEAGAARVPVHSQDRGGVNKCGACFQWDAAQHLDRKEGFNVSLGDMIQHASRSVK